MLLLAALLLFTETPDAMYRDGIAAFEAGQSNRALPLLEKAARQAESNAQYWKAYGVVLASRSAYVDSVEAFENACKLDRRLPDACYYLGRALYATDRYESALAPLRQSLETDSQKDRAETALAQALEALERNEEAEKLYRSAIARKGSFLRGARVAYGRFLVRAGRVAEGINVLDSAQQPESAEALLEYARALMQAGQTEAALPKLERLIQLTPRDAAARFLLGKAYRRLGRNAEAITQEQAGQALQEK